MNTPSPLVDGPPLAPTTSVATEAPPTTTTAPEREAGSPTGDKVLAYQKALLLDQLLQAAPEHKLTRAVANQKVGAPAKKHLGLDAGTADRVRDELAAGGFIRTTKKGRSITDELTDEGRVYLQTLEQYAFPSGPGSAKEFNEHVKQYLKPYLLLQLLKAQDHCLTLGAANRFDSLGKQDLGLTPGNARSVRTEMAAQGLIRTDRRGRSESYRLTDTGLAFLASHDQYPASTVGLKGEALNALLRAAREGVPSRESAPAGPTFAPRPGNLSATVLAEFEELRREKYGHTGRVPIYQLRERIAAKYGPDAARHDTLDEPILQLWRERQVRLVSLSDLQKATPEQLNASVPGVNETLFYMERAHG